MPTIALAAYSIYQGVQASNQAGKDRDARNAATARTEALGADDRNYYRQKFGPANQMLIDYAMGNKPSPYLAKAKGKIEQGYQQGMTQLNEIAGNQNLGESGIGAGQKIGLGMESAKAKAGLDLQDEAQRYGVAQSLSGMENQSLQGSNTMARAQGAAAGYGQSDMTNSLDYANRAFSGAAGNVGSYIQNLGAGGSWYGAPPPTPAQQRTTQTDKVESGGTKP
jgi:hypothetical protein